MPRIKEVKRCRAWVTTERNAVGNPIAGHRCLAPANRGGQSDCVHGREAAAWVAKYAPAAR